ncbi:protein bicaudal C [Musca domestica]|uniref:Protein bicaudal C n=1 Tax=Musca domestica TaxID=7370 RepID=A0ABM3VNK6_MUSDO|nr:protein bicaudal C [Musca domestica]XP_058987383.1 protein bicaudal C [Musca domestica]XP_058987384.1 protein bicaudal C [Musca domestica]XP_058987385.1 protein bicaudal C [Musca domestica]
MISCINKLVYPTAATVAAASAAATLASSSGAPSETQSEISSVDSDWSDIRAIALKLGVSNPDDLHTERFKVDRQKLEQMIKADSSIEGMNGAEYFFESVMKTTETYISWPCRLKIGAKSKKDPHVRIVGKADEVAKAKERILASLDSRGTRVIMKMDVSYTDHSYIIGRGGNNIKRIMEETATHIHFPDSNRSNPTEKSNQVSLCGSLEGVEKARSLVRLSTPLLISFELPVMAAGRPQPDRDTPYVTMVEQKYNVQVIFSSRPKLHSSLVLVKGSEKEAGHVQEATQTLINFSCENIASQILVNMQLEISPQHHEIVKGKNNTNLLSIMERTNTKIIFPDLSDMNVKPLKKSQVTITGTIEGVYKARQQLLGNLPIALIFDFPDNQNDASEIMSLSTKYGVYITLRQKQRQSTLAIVIKGVEKFIDKIYEARQEILRLTTPLIKPDIPERYFMPQDKDFNLVYRTTLTALLAGYNESPKALNVMPTTTGHLTSLSPYGNNNNLLLNNNNNNNNNLLNNNNNNNNANLNQLNRQQFGGLYPTTPTGICSPTQKYLQIHNSNYARQQQQQQQQIPPQQQPPHLQHQHHNNNYLQVLQQQQQQQQQHHHHHPQQQQHQQQTQMQPPTHIIHQQQQQQQHIPQTHNISPRNSCSNNTSGYQSFSSSTTSLEQAYPPFGNALGVNTNNGPNGPSLLNGNRPSPFSPDSNYSSEAGCSRLGRRSSDGVLLGLGASGPIGPMVPGSAESYRNSHYDLKHNRTFDFDIKRAMGFKAMERPPVAGELRTPTPSWMGMGLSRTSPVPFETVDDLSPWHRGPTGCTTGLGGGAGSLVSPYGLGATTGIVDSTPTNRRLQLTQYKDIHTLLTALGLEHYIKIFVLNEIDLEMFMTLTEENLMELGITAFGARKKMLVAIHTLQANEATTSTMPQTSSNASSPRFSGSAAPGAERRPSNQW